MSDAQLRIFLAMILTQLNEGIDTLEKSLPTQFKFETGGSNILLDPLKTDYPVLHELYRLRNDLEVGIDVLDQSTSQK